MKIVKQSLIAGVIATSVAMVAGAAQTKTGATTPIKTSGALTSTQQQAVQVVVKNYLMKNPEIIIQAIQAYQVKQQQAQVSQSVIKIKANTKALFDNAYSPVAGNVKGNVTLVEFYDFRCPHCKDATKTVDALITANPNLKVIYKDFPIFGGASMVAAKASLATYKMSPSKYQAFHDALMAFKGDLSDSDVYALAKKTGYNVKTLKAEIAKPWVENQIKADFKVGTTIGVNATPMFVVGNLSKGKFAFIPGAMPQKTIQAHINQVQ